MIYEINDKECKVIIKGTNWELRDCLESIVQIIYENDGRGLSRYIDTPAIIPGKTHSEMIHFNGNELIYTTSTINRDVKRHYVSIIRMLESKERD